MILETEGYVKCSLGPFISRDSEYTLDSIVSDGWKVEIKLNQNNPSYHNLVTRGHKVRVSGSVVKFGDKPPFIQLSSRNDYEELPAESRLPFFNVIKNVQNIQ